MNQLQRFDTTALANLSKALIGFDRIFNDVERRAANSTQNNYPPCNIYRTSDTDYVVEMAVTGFSKDEITVEVDQNELVIKAESKTPNESAAIEYIHRGLAARDIEKRFGLTEHMEVGEAKVANGLLTVYITVIVPEAPKPRQIEIQG